VDPADDISGQPADDRLDSWKEIAAYLRRDITTVQRWEKREGMPVRRHVHDKMGSVYGFRSELDAWAQTRNLRGTSNGTRAEPTVTRPHPAGHDEEAPMSTAAAELPSLVSPGMPRARGRWRAAAVLAAGSLVLIAAAAWWLLARTEYFWHDPLAGARFVDLTDFDGTEHAATVSRDGRFVAFLSDRDGQVDVWLTQIGSGQFHNLTRGRVEELVNPSVRTLGFSPDGALVTFWARTARGASGGDIGIWAMPTLGGQPRPYLEGTAEFAWSSDGSRLVYHTPGPGDPMFVRDGGASPSETRIFRAAEGLHAHFPLWSLDGEFIYFVQGELPDRLDLWRIRSTGEGAERLTFHEARVSHPVLLDERTLMYLATDRDGSGPWLHSIDLDRRVPHRLGGARDRYSSLAASADGQRIVATLANPKGTFWRTDVDDTPAAAASLTPIALTTARGFSPRLGHGYVLYNTANGTTAAVWKLEQGAATELWSAPDSRISAGPEISRDGRRVAFCVERRGKTLLYAMDADGTNARVITDSLLLRGAPAWAPDGQSIIAAADVQGTPHLFRISLAGVAVDLVQDYARDPVWSPRGDFVIYSGADVGTTFHLKAIGADGTPYYLPPLTLTRGARRVRFIGDRRVLIVLRGEIQHKNLWLIDLDTGAERPLTNLPPGFDVQDFDVSADGHEIVLERVQEHSDVVLIDRHDRK
jgi:Tol biopolymer transport system component